MFPIRDHNPATRTPWVTYALIVINVAVFLSYAPLLSDQRALYGFFLDWAILPARLTSGADGHTLITSMFLHGGWMHLFGNMLFLFIFGDNVEDQLGHGGFLGFYLVSGIGAGLMQALTDPASMVPLVGASGAIAGVMGGYLLLFPKARVDLLLILIIIFRIITVPAWLLLGLWFGMQVFSGMGTQAGTGGVAFWAHAGGFVLGLALMLPVWLAKGGPGFWARTHGHPDNPEARYRLRRTGVPQVARSRGPIPQGSTSRPPRVPRRRRSLFKPDG
jgi:membrane associated rhomboid family serine protease